MSWAYRCLGRKPDLQLIHPQGSYSSKMRNLLVNHAQNVSIWQLHPCPMTQHASAEQPRRCKKGEKMSRKTSFSAHSYTGVIFIKDEKSFDKSCTKWEHLAASLMSHDSACLCGTAL